MSEPKKSDGECCPYCGGTGGVEVSERAIGWVKRDVEWGGEIFDTTFDGLRETPSKTAKCYDCGRVVQNPMRK